MCCACIYVYVCTLLWLLLSLPSLQNCARTSPTKYASRDLSFNVDESDSEEEAHTESEEPEKASFRKKRPRGEKMTSEEREPGANVAGQTMISLIGKMEANLLREVNQLKSDISDIGARQNAVESRLDMVIARDSEFVHRLDKLKSDISDIGARLQMGSGGRLDINGRNCKTPKHCYSFIIYRWLDDTV